MKKKLMALFLVLALLVSTLQVASAAQSSGIYFNTSKSAITSNGDTPLPAACGSVAAGSNLYFNVAATSDWTTIQSFELRICKPGSSSYQKWDSYSAASGGFIRWWNSRLSFSEVGTYSYQIVVRLKNGTAGTGTGRFTVTKATTVRHPNVTNVSAAFRSSVYYQRLMQVELTGNPRTDIVAIALSQVGYHEGSLAGTSSSSNNLTEYGRRFDNSYGAWCAYFCAYVGQLAGCPIKATGCADADDLGLVYHERSEYTPRPGDIVIFDWAPYCTKTPRSSYGDHVGIVVKVENGRVYTVEGNSSNQVQRCDYSLTSSCIKGYGTY